MSFTFAKHVLQLVGLQFFLFATPATAAQEVFINVSAFEAGISVETLEHFGKTGEAKGLLKRLLQELSPEERQTAQLLFSTRMEVEPVRLSQFLYTAQGQTLLEQLGQILQSESGLSGAKGLRSALFMAASDAEEGLTIPNVIQHFPGDRIRLNGTRILELAKAWQDVTSHGSTFALPKSPHPEELVQRFPLREQLRVKGRGKFRWELTTDLETPAGDTAALYMPTSIRRAVNPNDIGQRPVIVLSHGLGGDRTAFKYLAEHLVTHGFVVIAVDHPLLSTRHRTRSSQAPLTLTIDTILEDEWAKKISPQDFAQRPLAISRLLDALEQRQQTDPLLQGKVNLQQVGVLGHSFGGYTALAVGGATIDPSELERHCPADAATFNPSLVLQCRAWGLRDSQLQYRDPRVKAIAAINPVASAILGPQGIGQIDIPIMLIAGSDDVVTPPRAEQLPPFEWLTTRDRYLGWIEGGTHFSAIEQPTEEMGMLSGMDKAGNQPPMKSLIQAQQFFVGEHDEQVKQYLKASSLAFFHTHLAQQAEYAQFLTSDFAALLSHGKALKFSLVQDLNEAKGE